MALLDDIVIGDIVIGSNRMTGLAIAAGVLTPGR